MSRELSLCPELTFTLVLACNAIGPAASTVDPITTLRLVYAHTHAHTYEHTHTYTDRQTDRQTDTHTHTRAYSVGKCTKASTNMHSKQALLSIQDCRQPILQ